MGHVGSIENIEDLKKDGLFCGSLLWNDEVFAYVGRHQNVKDLTAT